MPSKDLAGRNCYTNLLGTWVENIKTPSRSGLTEVQQQVFMLMVMKLWIS
jgi:hypothetical protein